jgi:hypothetical protein
MREFLERHAKEYRVENRYHPECQERREQQPEGDALVGCLMRSLPSTLSKREIWLPFLDTYRTLCLVPGPELMGLLKDVRSLSIAA